MSIILIIVIGAIVGWIAAQILGRHEGFMMSAIIGIVGSFIGSLISELTTGSNRAYLSFSVSGLIWSIIGSVILVAIINGVSHTHSHHTV
jgi:uncharacterized membrane protein YeaQ/YmgE (transglycosylase-associated protein family)